jgi:hypothetical protein
MMFLILLVEELEGCLEWTLKFQEEAEQTRLADYISVGKKIAVTAAVTWYKVLEKLLILLILMLLQVLQKRIWRMDKRGYSNCCT